MTPTIQISNDGVDEWGLERLTNEAGVTVGYRLEVTFDDKAPLLGRLGRLIGVDQPVDLAVTMHRAGGRIIASWRLDRITRRLSSCTLLLSASTIQREAPAEPEQTTEGP